MGRNTAEKVSETGGVVAPREQGHRGDQFLVVALYELLDRPVVDVERLAHQLGYAPLSFGLAELVDFGFGGCQFGAQATRLEKR